MVPPLPWPAHHDGATGDMMRTEESAMKTLLLTNEYPPHVYGGAGVHVEFLSRELAKLIDVEVRSFGDQAEDEGRLTVRGYGLDEGGFTAPRTLTPVFGAFSRNVAMAATDVDADVV